MKRYKLTIGPIEDDPGDLSPEDRMEMLAYAGWRDVRIEWIPETAERQVTEHLILIPDEEHRDLYRIESRPTAEEALRYGQQEVGDWCQDAEANGRWDKGIDRICVVEVIGQSEPHWSEQAEVPSRYDLNDLRGACIWNEGNSGCGHYLSMTVWFDPDYRYCPYCGKPVRRRMP